MADAYGFWAERPDREETRAIDDFWEAFARAAPRIERSLRGGAPHIDPDHEVRTALGPLADRLFWDFETDAEGRRRIVVTAELGHANRVLARRCALRFPDIEGWSASDHRLPIVPIPSAVRAILFRSRSEAMAVEEVTPRRAAHRLVDLVATGRGDDEFLADQAGVCFSVLLGDRADQDWLGETRARTVRRGGLRARLFGSEVPRNDRWLTDFRAHCVEIISRLEADRPEAPFVESLYDSAAAQVWRLRPVDGDPGRRHDMTTCRSRYPALATARMARVRIGTLRFSRFGECFCGVKIRRTPSAPFEGVADLAALAAAAEERLMRAGLGGLTGTGEGTDHVYLDLALMEIESAVRLLRAVLADSEIAAPAWLMFDEAGLEDRYLPLTAGAPPTPHA